jgi:hypothetical protein
MADAIINQISLVQTLNERCEPHVTAPVYVYGQSYSSSSSGTVGIFITTFTTEWQLTCWANAAQEL